MSIILGIDPGTTTTGFAIIRKKGNNAELLDYGIIDTPPNIPIEEKLFEIGNDINEIISTYNPDLAVIEKLFFTNNIKTGIDVSHARGVVLYCLYSKGIQMKHYTPLELKSAICGNGKATKKQLQNAIKMILNMETTPKPDDAADAIGLAYLGSLLKKDLDF